MFDKDITIINKYIDADRKTQYKISYVKKDFGVLMMAYQ